VDEIKRIGMDTSKHVFQLHGVNAAEQPVLRKRFTRKAMEEFFAKLSPCVIAIEACGASHHWARKLGSFGHEVKLIAPQHVIRCPAFLQIDRCVEGGRATAFAPRLISRGTQRQAGLRVKAATAFTHRGSRKFIP